MTNNIYWLLTLSFVCDKLAFSPQEIVITHLAIQGILIFVL